ncbi:MAG TPA: hypothetical protein VF625_16755 [Longimicrobium sp.]
MRAILSAATLCVLLASGAEAQAERPVFRFGADLISTSIDDAAAKGAGVGSRATGLQLTGGVTVFKFLSANLEGGIVAMSDKAGFTQETTGGERSSGVAAGLGTLSLGLRTPPVGTGGARPAKLSAGVSAGHTLMDATRTISECYNCHGESVHVEAGSFWEPVMQLDIGRTSVNARYRAYTGGSDLRDALIVGFAVVARRRPAPEASAPAS